MFSLLESFRSAMQSIIAHRFRSFLTTLGIVIGVSSVIAVVSVIQGLNYSITQQFKGLGSNSLTVRAYTPFKQALQGKRAKLSDDDYQIIKNRVKGINKMTPQFSVLGVNGGFINYQGKTTFANIRATTSFYQDVSQIFPEKGRFISAEDNKHRRRVAVIGTEIQRELELPENLDKTFLKIAGEWFHVIGLLEKQGDFLGISRDNLVLIPYNTGKSILGVNARPDVVFQFTVSQAKQTENIKKQIEQLLRLQHKIKKGATDDFKIQTPEQLLSTISKITDMLTLVLGGIVSISLLVGGIGIMNIMLVSVTERTREIGICKAIGAKRHHILMQFLIEAIVLSVLGGIIGIILGYGAGVAIAAAVPQLPAAQVPFWAIALAFGFSIFVGVIFGILPASKAANLNPIDALRFE